MFNRLRIVTIVAALLCTSWARADTIRQKVDVIPGALRYTVSQFDAHVGDHVQLTFTNTGLMPHNLVVGSQRDSADAILAAAAAIEGNPLEQGFVPKSPLVLTATKLLNVKQSQTLSFTAPDQPGDYPYVCTFPGHGILMRGVLRVRPAGEKLDPAVATHIVEPKTADALAHSTVTPRPMGSLQHPLVMRTFVPNLGFDSTVLAHYDRGYPSPHYSVKTGKDGKGFYPMLDGIATTVAVNFGDRLSYVWDTNECRLLYAWTGGFMDMTDYWGAGSGGGRKAYDYLPRLQGELVYKTAGPMPLSIGDSQADQAPKFRGYRLPGGTPQFMFTLGSTAVREQIVPGEDHTLAIHYQINDAPATVHLKFDPAIRPHVTAEKGTWRGDTLDVDAKDAAHFVILIQEQQLQSFKPFELPARKATSPGEVFASLARNSQGRGMPRIADGLAPGKLIFQDRKYKFGDMPDALRGAEYEFGFNNDANARAGYTMTFKSPATVYLLLDQRVKRVPAHQGLTLTKTGQAVKTDHNWTYDVYQADVAPGEYHIAPQAGGSMYVIAARKR